MSGASQNDKRGMLTLKEARNEMCVCERRVTSFHYRRPSNWVTFAGLGFGVVQGHRHVCHCYINNSRNLYRQYTVINFKKCHCCLKSVIGSIPWHNHTEVDIKLPSVPTALQLRFQAELNQLEVIQQAENQLNQLSHFKEAVDAYNIQQPQVELWLAYFSFWTFNANSRFSDAEKPCYYAMPSKIWSMHTPKSSWTGIFGVNITRTV